MQHLWREQIIELMKLQYRFARTGEGCNDYYAAREKLASVFGRAPATFSGTPDDAAWEFMRRFYFYDPAPTLARLRIPTLALFGELDDNILAEKNKTAWERALKTSGNRDYTLVVIPKADHLMLEATLGTNREMPRLQRFAPAYFSTFREWLAKRVNGLRTAD